MYPSFKEPFFSLKIVLCRLIILLPFAPEVSHPDGVARPPRRAADDFLRILLQEPAQFLPLVCTGVIIGPGSRNGGNVVSVQVFKTVLQSSHKNVSGSPQGRPIGGSGVHRIFWGVQNISH